MFRVANCNSFLFRTTINHGVPNIHGLMSPSEFHSILIKLVHFVHEVGVILGVIVLNMSSTVFGVDRRLLYRGLLMLGL